MPGIQETIQRAISIKGGDILRNRQLFCNILEDLSPDLSSVIAFIDKTYTDAVGEMLYKAYCTDAAQKAAYVREVDRILEEEEDRGQKSRKKFLSCFEALLGKADRASQNEEDIEAKAPPSAAGLDRKNAQTGGSSSSYSAETGKTIEHYSNGSVVEGYKINGIWNGPFTKTFANGAVFQGSYVNGAAEGNLVYIDPSGNKFVCEWHNGNWNGDGVYYSKQGVLKGRWVNGVLAGSGIYKYKNGRVYEGEIKNFLKDGHGCIKFPSGNAKLSAVFKEDAIVSKATISFPNGGIYVGAWQEGIDGQGTFTSSFCPGMRKISYSGGWKDGLPSGNGGKLTVIPAHGQAVLYEGDFSLGKARGYGCLYERNSNGLKDPIANGKWENNQFVSKAKSKSIKEGEKSISRAVDYIKTITAAIQ